MAAHRQSGNAATEYVILLMAVAIIALAIVMDYGQAIAGQFAGADGDAGLSSVDAGISGDAGSNDTACGFYFNPATGRWHDPATNLFVSFDDASAGGC